MNDVPAWVKVLPSLNAVLNAISASFLLLGYRFIRHRQKSRHRACMITAFSAATLFLISYLTLHAYIGTTRFGHEGTWIRTLYLSILTSHTILAMVTAPMVVMTLLRGLRGRFEAHRRLARKTFPLWLYVSVTGIIVYVMLYHFPGTTS